MTLFLLSASKETSHVLETRLLSSEHFIHEGVYTLFMSEQNE